MSRGKSKTVDSLSEARPSGRSPQLLRTKNQTVVSSAERDVAKIMRGSCVPTASQIAPRLSLNPENAKNGLARLALILIKLLHELLERQAMRRMDSGSLTEIQIERLGITLMKQAEEIERLRKVLHLTQDDLNIDLGPFGKLI